MPPRVGETVIDVEPLKDMLGGANRCPHVAALRNIRPDPQLDLQRLSESVGCYVCETTGASKLWLCLHKDCLRIVCSDPTNNHSHLHYLSDTTHCLHVNLASLCIWCYQCDREAVVMQSGPTGSDPQHDVDTTGSVVQVGGATPDQQPEVRPTGLTGLQNIGNTCYMNAALQALSNCPPLVQHFLSRPPPPSQQQPPPAPATATAPTSAKQAAAAASAASGDHPPQYGSLLRGGGNSAVAPPATPVGGPGVGGGLTRSFHRLMLDVWSPRRTPYVAPTAILYAIRKSHPMFRGFHQHDTQEFLRCLMDQLHEEMKEPNVEPPLQFNRPPSYLSLDTLEQISEGEGGAASSQSEGEEYETCDSGVSERSSLSEEATNTTAQPLRSLSRTPSPTGVELNRLRNSMKQQNHLMGQHGSPSRRKQISYRSIISDVFDGKLISSVQCLTCNRVSTRVETFQDLSLPIPNRDHLNMLHQGSVNTSPTKCTHLYPADQVGETEGWWAWLWDWVCSWFWGPTVGLHDCLAAFFSADELKGDNMYSCEKCNKLRNGVKYSRVLQCPEMLCVHLKRFRHELMFSSKINSYVTFPLEGLDLKPYLHPNCPSEVTTYDLTSVICHHGTAGGGHYTCYALNCQSGKWYEFDDHCVRLVSPETVRNCEAYVLFYRKDSSTVSRYRKRASRLQEMCSAATPAVTTSCGPSGEESGGGSQLYLVSQRWLDRFNTFAEPGPIDNRSLVCRHGGSLPDAEYVVLMQPVWDYLYQKFRGGPVCRADQVTPCEQCSERSAVTGLLRVQLNEFLRLQGVSHGGMYAIQGSWLCDWESYVKGYTPQPPGPIDNSSFVGQPGTGEDYFEVTGGQWELLVKLYGGGPPIQLKQPSAESDSRSLDERSNCDNLDSGCWLPNQNQAALENRPDSRVEDVTAGAAGVESCAGGGAASPQQPAQAPQDAVALSVGTEDEEGGGDTAEDGLLETGVASRQ